MNHILVADRYVMRALHRRGDGWAATYRDTRTGRVRTRKSREGSERKARDEILRFLEREAARGGGPVVKVKLSVAFAEFLEARTCRERTIETYRSDWKGGWGRDFDGWEIHQLLAADVEKWVARRRRKGAAAATIRKHVGLLRRLCRWAKRRGYLRDDPTEGVEVRGKGVVAPRALSADEARRLVAGCGNRQIRLAVIYALMTGVRRRNVLELRWRQLELEGAEARATYAGAEMKTGEGHAVPLHASLVRELRAERARAKVVDLEARVFGRYVAPHRAFRAAIERSGVGHLRWHDLRHTAATWLASRTTYAVVQAVLAHAVTGITGRYLHPSWEEMAEGVGRLPDITGGGWEAREGKIGERC